MHPGGVRSDTHLFYFEKSANLKHPSKHSSFWEVFPYTLFNLTLKAVLGGEDDNG